MILGLASGRMESEKWDTGRAEEGSYFRSCTDNIACWAGRKDGFLETHLLDKQKPDECIGLALFVDWEAGVAAKQTG